MTRTRKQLLIGLLAGVALLAVWSVGGENSTASSGPAPASPPPAAVPSETTSAPASASASRTIAGLGIVEPKGGTIELASELPGVITAVHVAEGDRVRRGDVVAELGNTELKAKVAQAEAQLAIRAADLKRIESGYRQQEIAQAESRVAELKADLDMSDADFERATRLQKSGTVSKKALQAAGNLRIVARQQLEAAQQALSLLKEGNRVEEVAAARAQVALAAEQLAEARAYVEKSIIRASENGTVLRLFREPGEAVSTQPSTALAEIGDTSRLVVRAQIDEAEIAGLAVGQAAEIAAPAFSDRRLAGRVVRISPRIGTKIVNADTADEKRDARVLDVIVELEEGVEVPVNLRVDVFIDTSERVAGVGELPRLEVAEWALRQ